MNYFDVFFLNYHSPLLLSFVTLFCFCILNLRNVSLFYLIILPFQSLLSIRRVLLYYLQLRVASKALVSVNKKIVINK